MDAEVRLLPGGLAQRHQRRHAHALARRKGVYAGGLAKAGASIPSSAALEAEASEWPLTRAPVVQPSQLSRPFQRTQYRAYTHSLTVWTKHHYKCHAQRYRSLMRRASWRSFVSSWVKDRPFARFTRAQGCASLCRPSHILDIVATPHTSFRLSPTQSSGLQWVVIAITENFALTSTMRLERASRRADLASVGSIRGSHSAQLVWPARRGLQSLIDSSGCVCSHLTLVQTDRARPSRRWCESTPEIFYHPIL